MYSFDSSRDIDGLVELGGLAKSMDAHGESCVLRMRVMISSSSFSTRAWGRFEPIFSQRDRTLWSEKKARGAHVAASVSVSCPEARASTARHTPFALDLDDALSVNGKDTDNTVDIP